MTLAKGEPRLSRAEAKARTRELLLIAAADVFAKKGFSGASVEEIADKAGYSIGALYSNFENKEQLFMELMSNRATNRILTASQIIHDGGSNTIESISQISKLLIEIADKDTEFALLQVEFWLYAMRNPKARDKVSTWVNVQLNALDTVVSEVLKRKNIDPGIQLRDITSVILSLFKGMINQRRLDPESIHEDLFAKSLYWLFEGLRQTASNEINLTDTRKDIPQ